MTDLFSSLPKEKSKKTMKGILYADGGSRGNPGKCAGGAVLFDENKKEIDRVGNFYGIQTNNYAEYMGAIDGMQMALDNNITDLQVFLDSKLIVEQLNGAWKVKNINIKPLFEKAAILRDFFSVISFTHVLRDKNKVADSIVNEVLDQI